MPSTIPYLDYGGYRYQPGDLIRQNVNQQYQSSEASSPVNIPYATDNVWRIDAIWDGPLVRNPIQILWHSGPEPSYSGGGYIRPEMIVPGSGGTPLTHTVYYNANGGTGAPASQTKVYGTILTLSTTVPTRSGYVFSRWNTSPDGSGTSYYPGGQYGLDEDVTLYAIWTPQNYTVTYNANGGTGAPRSQTKPYGTSIQLSSTIPSKAFALTYNANGGSVSPTSKSVSCRFVSWNTRADGSGTLYSPGETYSANANLTLYAIWSNTAAGSLPTPTRTNCRFQSWTTTLNGNTVFNSSSIVSSDMTIYAKWQYGVTLNGNGGTIYITESNSTVTTYTLYKSHGVNLQIPDYMCTYSRTDEYETPYRRFIGYSANRNSTTSEYPVGSQYTVNEPATLYAIYQAQTYTVRFTDGYSGAVLLQYNNVAHGSSVDPPPDPERDGYTFAGWLGDYDYIVADTEIKAFWGFTPVWVMTTSGWVKYEPKEG